VLSIFFAFISIIVAVSDIKNGDTKKLVLFSMYNQSMPLALGSLVIISETTILILPQESIEEIIGEIVSIFNGSSNLLPSVIA